jgi:hypothetical protein
MHVTTTQTTTIHETVIYPFTTYTTATNHSHLCRYTKDASANYATTSKYARTTKYATTTCSTAKYAITMHAIMTQRTVTHVTQCTSTKCTTDKYSTAICL